jgi:hypothetical protein
VENEAASAFYAAFEKPSVPEVMEKCWVTGVGESWAEGVALLQLH